MLLVHLSLTNFRNFIRLEMEFPSGPTLVVGPNAQGKTSLLEAVDYLVAAESSRASSDRELVNFLALHEPGGFSRIVAGGGRRKPWSRAPGDEPPKWPGCGMPSSSNRMTCRSSRVHRPSVAVSSTGRSLRPTRPVRTPRWNTAAPGPS